MADPWSPVFHQAAEEGWTELCLGHPDLNPEAPHNAPWRLGVRKIPAALSGLERLEALSLEYTGLVNIPPEISQLGQLEFLSLAGNRLGQYKPEWGLPEEIGQLRRLRWLDVSHNSLARLPDAIGQLENLEVLILSGNRLTGWPAGLGGLRKLKCLIASGNAFDGFPEDLSTLTHLTDVDVRQSAPRPLLGKSSWPPGLEVLGVPASAWEQLSTRASGETPAWYLLPAAPASPRAEPPRDLGRTRAQFVSRAGNLFGSVHLHQGLCDGVSRCFPHPAWMDQASRCARVTVLPYRRGNACLTVADRQASFAWMISTGVPGSSLFQVLEQSQRRRQPHDVDEAQPWDLTAISLGAFQPRACTGALSETQAAAFWSELDRLDPLDVRYEPAQPASEFADSYWCEYRAAGGRRNAFPAGPGKGPAAPAASRFVRLVHSCLRSLPFAEALADL